MMLLRNLLLVLTLIFFVLHSAPNSLCVAASAKGKEEQIKTPVSSDGTKRTKGETKGSSKSEEDTKSHTEGEGSKEDEGTVKEGSKNKDAVDEHNSADTKATENGEKEDVQKEDGDNDDEAEEDPTDEDADSAADTDQILEEVGPQDLSEAQFDALKDEMEPHEFQAEVARLMDIIINSLYGRKEVFLRELVSNAADALEKIRFMAVEDPSVMIGAPELNITVAYDKEAKTISVTDTGIGMTKEDLINNLGTVAKSGTANFLEVLSKGGDVNLIGQFGVGFYSAYLVADRVTVTSKHNDDVQHVWTSSAGASFTVVKDPRGNTLGRGTRITLHIKDDSTDLLEKEKLTNTLRKYSQFVNFPIYLIYESTVTVDVTKPEKSEDAEKDEAIDVSEGAEKKTEKVEKTVHKLTQVNLEKPIWLRPKEELNDTDYNSFYKSLINDDSAGDPLVTIHFSAEGEVDFKSLLFIPDKQPSDPYAGFFGKKQNIKLFVRRVLVAEEFDNLVPSWLTFMRGVVDSDDLPLKVDRESVAQSKAMTVITKRIVRKALDVMKKLATTTDKAAVYLEGMLDKREEDMTEEEKKKKAESEEAVKKFKQFYNEFGRNLKIGCIDDASNNEKIGKILRFYTTTSPDQLVSLETVANRTASNSTIYYITGENTERMKNSPLIKGFVKDGHEVLLLIDTPDEPCLAMLQSYEGRKLVSAEKETAVDDDLPEEQKTYNAKLKKHYEPLTKWWQEYARNSTKITSFGSRIARVDINPKLVGTPAVVISSSYGDSAYTEKVRRYQTFHEDDRFAFRKTGKILQINPQHPVVRQMRALHEADPEDPKLTQAALDIQDGALISSGYMDNAPRISERLLSAVSDRLGVDSLTEPEQVDVSHVEIDTPKASSQDDDEIDPAPMAENDEGETNKEDETDTAGQTEADEEKDAKNTEKDEL